MKKFIRYFVKTIKIIFFALVVVIACYSIYNIFCTKILKQKYPMVFGYSYSVIISQSMEPTLNIGDMIFVKRCESYEEGDIIVFLGVKGVTTHRVYQKTSDGYITWGDNRTSNPVPDDEIPKTLVYGKVISTAENLGYILLFFKSLPGMVCLAFVAIGFVFIPSAIDKFFDNLEQKEKEKFEKEKKEKEILKEQIKKELSEQNIAPNNTGDSENEK